MTDTERIADGEDEIADFELIAVAKLEHRQAGAMRIDFQHGEVGMFVGKDDFGLEFAAVIQHYRYLLRTINHMAIGDDGSIGTEDHA